MAKKTLFEILSGQPWWVTLLVALGIFWLSYAIFPPIAPFMALPFVLLAIYVAFKQFRSGPPSGAYERLKELREMPWESFSAAVSEAYRRRGYAVTPADSGSYDFRLVKDGQTTLLQCRRWKVNQVGEGPVRELAKAVEKSDASRGICLTGGDFSAPARKLAAGEPVTLLSGRDLVELVGRAKKRPWWFRIR
ncbi:MAG TPA: restriction endonuclease [Burkholderiales bacterium]|nr:restriction endonuclease [Burkholderiales bacterium]